MAKKPHIWNDGKNRQKRKMKKPYKTEEEINLNKNEEMV
jgi:hypothetical protein